MKNVLVFPCGSEIGLEIYKSLRYSTHYKVFGGSSVSDHGEFEYANYIGGMPFVAEKNFINKMNEVVEKFKIDYIFPAHDSVVLALAQAQASGRLRCSVITSSLKTCELARSKLKTYKHFKGFVPTPEVYDYEKFTTNKINDTPNFPVFLKPDVGQGSKGTYKAYSRKELDLYLSKDKTLIILEYLPGKEYTVDCFTDKEGRLLYSSGRERVRISNGISVRSSLIIDERFVTLARKINQTLDFRGAWFFQVKEDKKGELVLMEIAPRIAGTMALSRARGVNLPLLSLFDAENQKVSIFDNSISSITIDRSLQNSYNLSCEFNHVYVDYDDTVIVNEKVNVELVRFLYMCINSGVKLHLLTKHAFDLKKSLKLHRLEEVFDDIIVISREEEKSNKILERPAIFIDDSFLERKKVYEKLGISTFDTHAVEALQHP